jgi:hypothetical protein
MASEDETSRKLQANERHQCMEKRNGGRAHARSSRRTAERAARDEDELAERLSLLSLPLGATGPLRSRTNQVRTSAGVESLCAEGAERARVPPEEGERWWR